LVTLLVASLFRLNGFIQRICRSCRGLHHAATHYLHLVQNILPARSTAVSYAKSRPKVKLQSSLTLEF
jgi:hypothetical protein